MEVGGGWGPLEGFELLNSGKHNSRNGVGIVNGVLKEKIVDRERMVGPFRERKNG